MPCICHVHAYTVTRPSCVTDPPILPLHNVRLEVTTLTNGTLSSMNNITLYFQCKQGYSPTEQFTANCLRNDTWSPNPNIYTCSGYTLIN